MSDYTTPKGDEYLNFIGVGGSPADSDVFDVAQDDLRHIKKFGEAFREARKRGLKVFKWGKSTYTTELDPEPKKESKENKQENKTNNKELIDYTRKYKSPFTGEATIPIGNKYPKYQFPLIPTDKTIKLSLPKIGLSLKDPVKTHFLAAYGFKNGGTMTKYQQGGAAPQQDLQQQVIQLVQTAMDQQNPNSAKAMETINQIMKAAENGDEKSIQIAQMIQQVIKQMQGQATSAKWGSKLQYIKSIKYAKGGKTCPACMREGGQTEKNEKVKVAYKDIDTKTYQNLPGEQKVDADLHRDTYVKQQNKDGSYTTSHKPTSSDSLEIHKKHMSPELTRKYAGKKACGGKTAKKRYFGGWL